MSLFVRQDPSKLQAQLAQLKGANGFQKNDPTEWKLKQDAMGNGEAVIRFLPARDEDSLPIVKLVNHGIKMNGKWYIENCSSTHGDFDSCPVCQYISQHDLYNTDKSKWQNMKRKTSYWANILVIKDPANPSNEGKVFKFRFGEKIYAKILAMGNVNTDLGEVPVNPMCPFTGCNFLMKLKKVDNYTNYDDCRFMQQAPMPRVDDPEFQKYVMEAMQDLSAIVAKDKFLPFDELKQKLEKVIGGAALKSGAAAGGAAALQSQLDDFDKQMAAFDAAPAQSAPQQSMSAFQAPAASTSADDLLGSLDDNTGGDMDFDLDSLLDM